VELFALEDDIARCEARLAQVEAGERLPLLVALAWYLRQSDTTRALRFAVEAEAVIVDSAANWQVQARLNLVRAEEFWLHGDLASAEVRAQDARSMFDAHSDTVGVGDAEWVLASVAHDRGDRERCSGYLAGAALRYAEVGDVSRAACTEARRLWYAAFQDPIGTRAVLAERFGRGGHESVVVTTWIDATRAIITDLAGDFGESSAYFLRAYRGAVRTGQLRAAVTMAANAGDKFSQLHDLASAITWDETALAIARKAGWPAAIGQALMQTGNAFRLLGRHDEAHAHLCEAVDLMSKLPNSRNYAISLGYLGELALNLADYAAALSWFRQDEDCIGIHGQPDMLIGAWHGQARALSGMGRVSEAVAKAESSLSLARHHDNVEGQVAALRVLADLHRRHGLPAPADAGQPTATLHFLSLALNATSTIAGYVVSDELRYELAAEYAAIGEYKQAYENALLAGEARDRKFNKEAHQRAVAMQMREEAGYAWDGAVCIAVHES
jgi:tetratricopeptide (TPR) repeat protein